jgi:hypothetical protein
MIVKSSLVLLAAAALLAQDPYKGPIPETADIPHLRHANKLVAADTGEAKEDSRKDDTVYVIPGAAAKAQTPLAEPIFIVKVNKLNVKEMMLYKMDVKGGQRELSLPKSPKKRGPKNYRLSLDPLGSSLYKLEVQEQLENGEYCLSPNGSNQVFCFAVY